MEKKTAKRKHLSFRLTTSNDAELRKLTRYRGELSRLIEMALAEADFSNIQTPSFRGLETAEFAKRTEVSVTTASYTRLVNAATTLGVSRNALINAAVEALITATYATVRRPAE